MKTWKVQSEGESWTVDAPDDVTEAEVNEFAAANYAAWVNGGHYRMDPMGADVPKLGITEPELGSELGKSAPAADTPTRADYDAAIARLKGQMAKIDAERQRLASENLRSPSRMLDSGGIEEEPTLELDRQYADLAEQLSKIEIGGKGQLLGGVGGALAGGGLGVAMGTALGPPGMAIGGLIGSILGGAGGVAAGTHLWDIPAARETREVTDQEAAELIKNRAIESLIYDGAFTLILGPGGRVIGKMSKGARFLPALKAAAKDSIAWDKIPKVKERQLLDVVAKRADKAPPGLSTRVSRALDVPTPQTSVEATEELLLDMAARSEGRLPTPGEMSGIVEGGEAFVRRQAPAPFFKNDQILADTATRIRTAALGELDKAGALTGPELGLAVKSASQSADRAIKRVTGPIFERARAQAVAADMSPAIKVIDDVLTRYERSAGRLGGITKAEVDQLRAMRTALTQSGTQRMWLDGLQDFISGNKAVMRATATDGTAPTDYFRKVLGDLIDTSDKAYLAALRTTGDKKLVKDLLDARKLYGETLSDLYSDSLAKLADKRPEAYGAALTAKGHVTEIRELRTALDRAAKQGAKKPIFEGKGRAKVMVEQSGKMLEQNRKRIDAGMIKGFIEKHTQSLENLETKLADPDFRLTLKELLTGKGVADPALGQRVLTDLDRVLGAIKLASPTMAPQPGRLGIQPMGSVGAATTMSAATGQNIQGAVPLVYLTFGVTRLVGKIAANAYTSGNVGMLRTLERAITLSRLAGTNAAAGEAARAAWNALHDWDVSTGGQGITPAQGQ